MPNKTREQQEFNKVLGQTETIQKRINDLMGDDNSGFLHRLQKINAQSVVALKDKEKSVGVTKTEIALQEKLGRETEKLIKNYPEILSGKKKTVDLEKFHEAALKSGNKELLKQVKSLKRANLEAKVQATAYGKAGEAVDNIVDRVKESTFGFVDLSNLGDKFKTSMFKSAGTKGGMKSLLKSSKFLKIGLAGAVLAAAAFGKEVNETQKDLGTSFQQTAKILATTKAVTAANKLNGMTQEDTLSIVKGIASEFGSFSDATTAATLQASNLVANFGVGAETVGKLAKNIQVVSGGTLESSLDSAEFLANMARAADVPVGDVMNDVANNSELFAKFGKEGGRNIAEAAIQAKKLGLELSSVSAIAEGLLNFEDSITKELEAELLLGRDINLEKARELAFNNDIAGALAEVSKIVSPEEFQKLDAVRRQTLAAAAGLDVGAFARAISGGGGGGPSFQSLGDTSAASIRSGAATAHAGETIVRTSNFDMGETNELLRSMKSEIQRLGTS